MIIHSEQWHGLNSVKCFEIFITFYEAIARVVSPLCVSSMKICKRSKYEENILQYERNGAQYKY